MTVSETALRHTELWSHMKHKRARAVTIRCPCNGRLHVVTALFWAEKGLRVFELLLHVADESAALHALERP